MSSQTLVDDNLAVENQSFLDIPENEMVVEEEQSLLGSERKPYIHSSTFNQTLINSINLLMGMGIISIPFAFSRLGWGLALSMLIIFSMVASYTATLLGLLMKNTRSKSIHDIAELAFGPLGRSFVGILFTAELLTASVAMLILFADSMISLFPILAPYFSLLIIFAWIMLVPLTISHNISRLTYLSGIGVLSLIALVLTILYDGFSTNETPGSLLYPMPTKIEPSVFESAIVGIGLLFVGLDGHAVFPSLYRDMKKSDLYPKAIQLTYLVVVIFYGLIGVTGYLMFGDQVKPEIIQNLSLPQYNPILIKVTLTLITLNPLTKFPLIMIPVNMTIESWLELSNPLCQKISRFLVSLFVLLIALLIPSFLKIMGFLGASLSFLIAGIVPIACYIVLKGGKVDGQLVLWESLVAYTVLLFVSFMMILGTLGVIFA